MSNFFNITDTLYSITEQYPETVDVFVSNGFPQMENVDQRQTFGKMITFEAALKMKDMNPETFMVLLNEVITAQRSSSDATLAGPKEKSKTGLNVVGLLPCPVRIPLLEQYNDFAEKNNLSNVNTELKAASVGTQWVEENLDKIKEADDLPDLFISAGFDLFFDAKKIGQFRQQGVFADLVAYQGENSLLKGRNLQDPSGNYSLISIVPAVFLVNTSELGEREIPRSWADILKPEWEKSVSLPIKDFDLFNAILLSIQDRYGDEGVRNLGRSLLLAMHPAQMVKSNRMKESKPAVTVMPYFFSRTVKPGGNMQTIWPEDGAIVSPIFMLAKKERAEELQPIVDFFASKEVGETLSHKGSFPSLHPEVVNDIPDDAPMMWPGWDKILQTDLSAEIGRCMDLFDAAAMGETI